MQSAIFSCHSEGAIPFAPEAVPTASRSLLLQEILSDARVVASQLGGRGGRVRDETESAEAKTVTVTNDGREKAVAPKEAVEAVENPAEAESSKQHDQPATAASASNGVAANVEEARSWIAAWKAKQGGGPEAEPAAPMESSNGGGVSPNVAEAREWIRGWRAKQLESKLPVNVE